MLLEGSFTRIADMVDLPGKELAAILRQGALLRLPFLEERLLQAREQVERFEERYGMTLDVLKSQGLPEDADYAMHEDFIEWEYWEDVLREKDMTVKGVKAFLKHVEASIDS